MHTHRLDSGAGFLHVEGLLFLLPAFLLAVAFSGCATSPGANERASGDVVASRIEYSYRAVAYSNVDNMSGAKPLVEKWEKLNVADGMPGKIDFVDLAETIDSSLKGWEIVNLTWNDPGRLVLFLRKEKKSPRSTKK